MFISTELKQSKIIELTNLITQYENNHKENINVDEYPKWILIVKMLQKADIETEIYKNFLLNPTYYKIDGDIIVYNDNWQQELEQAELERINKLNITKLDFYTYLCEPANITYQELVSKVYELKMEAQWELCNHVFYGVMKPFLTALDLQKNDKEILEIFETYNAG